MTSSRLLVIAMTRLRYARGVSMFAVSREDRFAGVIGAENNRMT